MGVGIFNLVMGLAAMGAGLTGRGLIGTGSPLHLMILGGAICLLGLYQIVRSRRTD